MTGVVGISYRLGSTKVSALEAVREYANSDAVQPSFDVMSFVEQKQLQWVHIEPTGNPEVLLRETVADLLEKNPVADRIEAVIYGGQVDHDGRGAIPFKIAHEIGVSKDCRVMWHFIGCGTALSAIELATRLVRPDAYALILLNCVIDTSVHPRVMADMLCGDGVMAILVGPHHKWAINRYAMTNLLKNHSFALVEGVTQDSLEVLAAGVDHVRSHHTSEELAQVRAVYPVFNGFANWKMFARRIGMSHELIRTENTFDGAHIDSMDPVRSFVDRELFVDHEEVGNEQNRRVMLYAQTLGNTFHTMLLEKKDDS